VGNLKRGGKWGAMNPPVPGDPERKHSMNCPYRRGTVYYHRGETPVASGSPASEHVGGAHP